MNSDLDFDFFKHKNRQKQDNTKRGGNKEKALKQRCFKAFEWLRGWDLNHTTSGL